MLRKKLLAVAVISAFTLPGAVLAEEAASPHSLTGNLTFTTDYVFRGVSQTNEDAAVQGGLDYSHTPTGLYVGTWASNVNFPPGSLELDVYGGWTRTWGDFGVNVGLLHYDYPGNSSLNTDELYVGGSWKWFAAKYSSTISDAAFGVLDAKGTGYLELNFSYTLPHDYVLGAHYGTTMFDGQAVPGTPNDQLDYDDYKVSVARAIAGYNFALAYTGTDYDPAGGTPDIFDDRIVLSVTKTF